MRVIDNTRKNRRKEIEISKTNQPIDFQNYALNSSELPNHCILIKILKILNIPIIF